MGRKMLWLGLMLIVIGLCSSGTLATTMGPPAAGLAAGKYGVGLEYSNSEIGIGVDGERTSLTLQKVYLNDVKIPELDKEFPEGPEYFKFDEEFESDMIFANLGYGLSDKLEVFLRLGMAGFDANDMDGSDEFAYGLGAKATFYEVGNLKLGALFQMTWAKADGDFYEQKRIVNKHEIFGVDEINEIVDTTSTWEIDYYQLKFAIGPTYKLAEAVSIYGGPFYHLVSGDYEMERSGEKIEDTLSATDITTKVTNYSEERSGDIEEQSSFGAYIGAQVDLAKNLPLCIEYQFTSDADVLGAGLVYRF